MKKFLYDEIAKRWLNGCDSIWIYSDTHFSDVESYELRGLLKVPDDLVFAKEQSDSRPYDLYIEERIKVLDEMQIKNINSKAGKNSCLIILGDIGNLECIKKLKAKRKILIMGNHDKGASNYKRVRGFDINLSPDERVILDNHLFDEVYEGPVMINDRTILSHEPVFAGVPYFKNIHGHKHDKNYKGDDHHLNCCAEAINYEPINLLSLFKKGFLKNIDSIHRMTIDTAAAGKKRK